VKRCQKACFLSLRSSKIIVTKGKERRKRKSEEKEWRRRRKKKAMVALLVFIIATLENVHLAIIISKIRLDIHSLVLDISYFFV